MNNKFLIKTVALMVLKEIYLKSDYNFRASLNVNTFVNEKVNIEMIQKAATYLKEKNYIQYDIAPYEKWTVTMTAAGVDWVEECYNINPTDHIKE